MDNKQVLRELRDYINCVESSLYLFKMKDKFKDSLELIERHIKMAESKEEIKEFDPRIVEICVDFLIKNVIEKPRKDSFYNFVGTYVLLVLNWNDGVLKNAELTNRLMRLKRFIMDSMRLYERLQVVDILVNKLSGTNQWKSPSFELSNHYFNLIRED